MKTNSFFSLHCINFNSSTMKKLLQLIGIATVIGLLYFGFTTYPKLDLISGFSAKSMASGHFIDHRSQVLIEKGAKYKINFAPFSLYD